MHIKKTHTFCPRLWFSSFISNNGDVYGCCHYGPAKFGNIYDATLRDIWNSEAVKAARAKSLNGQLECFHSCRLLDKNSIVPFTKKTSINYDELRYLKILFGEMCNIHCIMCWQNPRNKEILDHATLIRNIDISPVQVIDIQGGEPLLIESAKKFFDYASSKGKKISFLTNGLLINDAWARKIAMHSLRVFFSINAATKKTHEFVNRGSSWELVLENIQKVRHAKEQYGSPVEIIGHMTFVVANLKEIPLLIKISKKIGFDMLSFAYDANTVPQYLRLHPAKKRRLKFEIKRAINNSDDKLLISNYHLKALGLV